MYMNIYIYISYISIVHYIQINSKFELVRIRLF